MFLEAVQIYPATVQDSCVCKVLKTNTGSTKKRREEYEKNYYFVERATKSTRKQLRDLKQKKYKRIAETKPNKRKNERAKRKRKIKEKKDKERRRMQRHLYMNCIYKMANMKKRKKKKDKKREREYNNCRMQSATSKQVKQASQTRATNVNVQV